MVAAAVVATLLFWAFRPRHIERWAALLTAVCLLIPICVLYIWLVLTRRWGGPYFEEVHLVAQLAALIAAVLVGLTVWLLGYGWLAQRVRQPLPIYMLLCVLAVFAVNQADILDLGQGLVIMGDDRTLWLNAVLGVLVLILPVLLFEGFRRRFSSDVLP